MDPNPTPVDEEANPEPMPRPESGVLTPWAIGTVLDPDDLALLASRFTRWIGTVEADR